MAIALALKRAGHLPVIATHETYRIAVLSAGVEFAPMSPDVDQFGDRAELMRRLLHPVKGPQFLIRDVVMPHVRGMYNDICAAAEGADTIVSHPLTFAARLVAEKQRLRWISTVLAPMSLFSALDPPIMAAAPWMMWVRKLGVSPYRALFALAKRVATSWERPLRALRAEIGLPPLGHSAQFEGQYAPELNLALFSRVLAEPQSDWPPNTEVCGFPRYDGEAPGANVAAELNDFLSGGEPPVVFTLGSAVAMNPGGFYAQAIEAIAKLRCRALLVTGSEPELYAEAIAAVAPGTGAGAARIKAFRYLPYSAIFPRAAVNVHQAGIGTLAQALSAGKPQLIVPAAFDQPDNAARAARAGVARVLPFQRASAARMAAELAPLLQEDSYRTRAMAIAHRLAREDGAARAAELIAGPGRGPADR